MNLRVGDIGNPSGVNPLINESLVAAVHVKIVDDNCLIVNLLHVTRFGTEMLRMRIAEIFRRDEHERA